ncbi:MAG: hypothetical protein LUM44_15700 [Pyrinomonadaceae bacterium]|nr:hypothetical protein [Pyrinomonadaceae bacterium]
MKSFSKNVSCPSSPKLLAFQKGDISLNEGITIQRHLIHCDFCAAEVEFYEHFPPIEDKIEATEMPKPLRELAEALLGNRSKDFSVLDKLLPEKA